jgi:hypothetical protein
MKAPTTAKGKRELIKWLQEHPLWTHSEVMKVPPGFPDTNTQALILSPETEDWVDYEYQDGCLQELLEIDFVYVDPTTERIEEDESRNTAFRVWLETGGWIDNSLENPELKGGHFRWSRCHDIYLDCGAATLEDALVRLATLVRFYYGESAEWQESTHSQCEGSFDEEGNYLAPCIPGKDGFCDICGFKIRMD